jgi:myo-inositol-1(or 4)-monophosphatase
MGDGTMDMDAFRTETAVAIRTVKRALDLARSRPGTDRVTAKGSRDVVTAMDFAVEDSIRHVLTSELGISVVGEERGDDAPSDGRPYWLVDPICGTRNLASGIPLYCVNLALVEGGRVVAAVVGDPSTDEIHVAERDRGAWALTGGARRPLSTTDESRTIVIEEGRSTGTRRERAAWVTARAIRADLWDIRSFSTTLALPYVAAGRVAAYVLFFASALHAAAGSLVASEAGATVSDVDGRPWTLGADSIIASATPALHRALLELAREPGAVARR